MSNEIDINDAKAVLSKYISLMWELKKREEVIICLVDGKCDVRYPQVALEVIFLQLRKIIEIIVMSPMLINEKEYREASKNPEFDWRLKSIMANLSEANPSYYPQPVSITKQEGKLDVFEQVQSNFITKEELVDIYQHCSGYLHAQNPLTQREDNDAIEEIKVVSKTVKKIHSLLQTHTVMPIGNGIFYYICMSGQGKRPHGNAFGIGGELTEERERAIIENSGKIPESLKNIVATSKPSM